MDLNLLLPLLRYLFFCIFLIINTLTFASNYYVDSSSGSDSNNGLSASKAWKSLHKISKTTFSPGDSILLKKNSVWRETMTVTSSGRTSGYIYYGSYGSGEMPLILGSVAATEWTNISGNIWVSSTIVSDPYAPVWDSEIFFEEKDGSVKWGKVRTSLPLLELTEEYNWTWEANHIYINSPTDPGLRYKSVEIPQRQYGILLNNKQCITIDGLELRFQQNIGINETYPTQKLSGLIIKNCKLSFIGKKGDASQGLSVTHSDMLIQNNTIFEIGRRGISINTYGSGFTIQNIIIENNTMYNGYHTTGIDISTGAINNICNFNNITIRNNMFYEDVKKNGNPPEDFISELIFLQNYGIGGTFENIFIYNNIFKNPTQDGIMLENIQSSFIYNNTFWGFNPLRTNNTIHVKYTNGSTSSYLMNNIFYGNGDYNTNTTAVNIFVSSNTDVSEIKADYNLYYQVDERIPIIAIDNGNVRFRSSNWETMKKALGWEKNSPEPQDPMFSSSTGLHLQENSPAIGKGIRINMIQKDFEGNKFNNPPSIGAFEGNPLPVSPDESRIVILYPNPSSGYVSIVKDTTIPESLTLKVINMSGKLILSDTIVKEVATFHFPEKLNPGVYIVYISFEDMTIISRKLIVIK
jgi:hypothetical protein